MVRLNVNYMSNKTIADFLKPTIITAKHYDKTITIEIDHSDIDINELMEIFESITIGMGFSKDAFRNWVKEAGMDFIEEDRADEWEAEHPQPNEALKEAFHQYVANLPTEVVYNDYGQRVNKKK